MEYKGKCFIVAKQQGMLKTNMICHCFHENDNYVWMWFREPIFQDFHEVKVSKNNMSIFKEK